MLRHDLLKVFFLREHSGLFDPACRLIRAPQNSHTPTSFFKSSPARGAHVVILSLLPVARLRPFVEAFAARVATFLVPACNAKAPNYNP